MIFQVSAIIVNYNSGSYARQCIESLLRQSNVDMEIIVVDNNSPDGSATLLEVAFGNRITLIKNEENLGFSKANNLGASKASGEFLLLINPDTEVPDPDCIQKLIEYASQPTIGIVGPAIHEPLKNKYVLPRKTYPSQKKLKNKNKFKILPGNIAWILGACMMLRKSVFNELGGFDPDYFLYGEDADICLRARLAGYQIGYCDSAKIIHVGGASEQGATSLEKFLRKKRGFFLFCKKHYTPIDVLHIARMTLITVYIGKVKITLQEWLKLETPQEFFEKRQRLEASKIVAMEYRVTHDPSIHH